MVIAGWFPSKWPLLFLIPVCDEYQLAEKSQQVELCFLTLPNECEVSRVPFAEQLVYRCL